MNFLNVARTAPARYALLFAAFSAVVMAALLVLIYWWMSSLLERHLEKNINEQLAVLRDDFARDGRDAMLGLVLQHEEKYRDSPTHFLVYDGAGKVLGGDLSGVSAEVG